MTGPPPTSVVGPEGELPFSVRRLGLQRSLVQFPWKTEAEYRWSSAEQIANADATSVLAPSIPAPLLVATIPLEDARDAAATGAWPDAVVRFSPNGRWLAIGSFHGWLRIVDAWRGALLHQRRLAEGLVKQLAWSRDGRQLFVGEQSPDALVFALDTSALDDSAAPTKSSASEAFGTLWSQRLSDRLGTSRALRGDRYGVYSLPAAYDLHVADDGRLIVAGAHSWFDQGRPRRQSLVYCFSPTGAVEWTWPRVAPAEMTINSVGVDPQGQRVLVLDRRQAAAHDDAGPVVLTLLDGKTGKALAAQPIEPLAPHFDRVETWKSLAVSDDAQRAAVGLNDGRALLYDLAGDQLALLKQFDLGTPRVVGQTPIAAAVSYTAFLGDQLCLQTQNTHIPFSSAQAAQQAPAAHRGANLLTLTDRDGEVLWRYRGPFALTGNWCDRPASGPPRWLLATCRELPGAAEPGQFGLLLFDLHRPGGGSDKLVYHYATAGPVLFNADISRDGQLLAVVESPTLAPDGRQLYGTYQVHIVH